MTSNTALFTLGDVKQLYISLRARLLGLALLAGFTSFFAAGLLPSKYKIEAHLEDKESSKEQFVGFVKSPKTLRPLIEEGGLQIASSDFSFAHVFYEETVPLRLTFVFRDPTHFSTSLGDGVVGKEVVSEKLRFTMTKAPANIALHHPYAFTVEPWMMTAERLRKELATDGRRFVLSITHLTSNAAGSVQLINALMNRYMQHSPSASPLEFAVAPLRSIGPHPLLFALFAAAAAPLVFFLWAFARQLFRGFPLTFEKMQALRWPAAGIAADAESFSRLALFIDKSQVIALILGQGPDYSAALAERFACMGISCFILRGEHRGSELGELKKKYECILLPLNVSPYSTEAIAALRTSEKAVVTICNEKTEELTPFIAWAYHNGPCRLTFLTRT